MRECVHSGNCRGKGKLLGTTQPQWSSSWHVIRHDTAGDRGVVASHVIGPPGPSQFHSFVVIAPTLYGNSTNLWIRLSSLSLNLVGVDSMPLDLGYSNSAAVDEIKTYRGL
jgi:hypothetical protein